MWTCSWVLTLNLGVTDRGNVYRILGSNLKYILTSGEFLFLLIEATLRHVKRGHFIWSDIYRLDDSWREYILTLPTQQACKASQKADRANHKNTMMDDNDASVPLAITCTTNMAPNNKEAEEEVEEISMEEVDAESDEEYDEILYQYVYETDSDEEEVEVVEEEEDEDEDEDDEADDDNEEEEEEEEEYTGGVLDLLKQQMQNLQASPKEAASSINKNDSKQIQALQEDVTSLKSALQDLQRQKGLSSSLQQQLDTTLAHVKQQEMTIQEQQSELQQMKFQVHEANEKAETAVEQAQTTLEQVASIAASEMKKLTQSYETRLQQQQAQMNVLNQQLETVQQQAKTVANSQQEQIDGLQKQINTLMQREYNPVGNAVNNQQEALTVSSSQPATIERVVGTKDDASSSSSHASDHNKSPTQNAQTGDIAGDAEEKPLRLPRIEDSYKDKAHDDNVSPSKEEEFPAATTKLDDNENGKKYSFSNMQSLLSGLEETHGGGQEADADNGGTMANMQALLGLVASDDADDSSEDSMPLMKSVMPTFPKDDVDDDSSDDSLPLTKPEMPSPPKDDVVCDDDSDDSLSPNQAVEKQDIPMSPPVSPPQRRQTTDRTHNTQLASPSKSPCKSPSKSPSKSVASKTKTKKKERRGSSVSNSSSSSSSSDDSTAPRKKKISLLPHRSDDLYEHQRNDEELRKMMKRKAGLHLGVKKVHGKGLVFCEDRIYIPADLREKSMEYYWKKCTKNQTPIIHLEKNCFWESLKEDWEKFERVKNRRYRSVVY